MPKVEKVTISVPAELMAHIEGLRREAGANRSEVVTELLWRGWRQLEDERREERYRAAYQAQPETIGELEWADMAAAELVAGDKGKPDATTERKRRASR
jgi:Arc/MetJ-type ribon-helix-helix transcriptional regulator